MRGLLLEIADPSGRRTADSAYCQRWIGSSVFLDGRRPPGAPPETSAARRGTPAPEGRAMAEDPDRHVVIGDERAACRGAPCRQSDLRTGPRTDRTIRS